MVRISEIFGQVADLKGAVIKGLLVVVAVLLVACAGLGLYAKTLRLERDLSRSQVEDLSRVIDSVNRKVEEWKGAADRQEQAARKASELAEEIRVKGARRVAELEAAQIPADCSEAVEWGADQVLRTFGGRQ